MVTTPDRLGFHDLGSQALGASLIERLHAVQQLHGYLPRAELQQLAVAMERPLSEVMGVASFYHLFRLDPVWARWILAASKTPSPPAAYLSHWIELLKKSPRVLFQVFSGARQAAAG